MPQQYSNTVLNVLTDNGVASSDISILSSLKKDVTVYCHVQWQFEHAIETSNTTGEGPKKERHFIDVKGFNGAVDDLKHEALNNRVYRDAFMDTVLKEGTGIFSKAARRDLGRIGSVSLCEDCDRCGGSGRRGCVPCFSTGEVSCLRCRGWGRLAGGAYCGCSSGRISCGSCYGKGYHQCARCDGTGKSSTVATVSLTAVRKLAVKSSSQDLETYVNEILPINEYPVLMEPITQQRLSADGYKVRYTFTASIVEVALQVYKKRYEADMLVRNGRWYAFSTHWIFDDLLSPVVSQMQVLVSELGKAGPTTLTQFKDCMETPVLQKLLKDIKNGKHTDKEVAVHIKARCNAFISWKCANSIASMFNSAIDFLAPTMSAKDFKRPMVWASLFVGVWCVLLAEHGFTVFGDEWYARIGTALLMSGLISIVVFAFTMTFVATPRSARRCEHIQSALPVEFRRKHDASALEEAQTSRLGTIWLTGTALGIGFALFKVTPVTDTLRTTVNSLERAFVFMSNFMF